MTAHEVSELLRKAERVVALRHYDVGYDENHMATMEALFALAASFDQPGPLAWSEAEGRMVRAEPATANDLYYGTAWRFPAAGT